MIECRLFVEIHTIDYISIVTLLALQSLVNSHILSSKRDFSLVKTYDYFELTCIVLTAGLFKSSICFSNSKYSSSDKPVPPSTPLWHTRREEIKRSTRTTCKSMYWSENVLEEKLDCDIVTSSTLIRCLKRTHQKEMWTHVHNIETLEPLYKHSTIMKMTLYAYDTREIAMIVLLLREALQKIQISLECEFLPSLPPTL